MKTKFHEFSISEVYKGDKSWPAEPSRYDNHRITVTNTRTGKRTSFDYWNNETEFNRVDVLVAFQCFLDDALSYLQARDEYDFCAEFGYSYDDILEKYGNGYRAWKGCKEQSVKALRVVGNEKRMCDLANEIRDIEYAHYEEGGAA